MSRSAKVSIVSNVIALALVLAAWGGLRIPLLLPYHWHKMLHLLGVVLFVGNVSVGPLWVLVPYFRRDARSLRFAMQMIALADIVFTAPGVHLALWNGLAMASVFGGVRAQPWLSQTVWLLVSLTLIAPTVVLYYQEKAVRLAEAEKIDEAFRAALYRWSAWGMATFVPISLVFYLMVSKQRIW